MMKSFPCREWYKFKVPGVQSEAAAVQVAIYILHVLLDVTSLYDRRSLLHEVWPDTVTLLLFCFFFLHDRPWKKSVGRYCFQGSCTYVYHVCRYVTFNRFSWLRCRYNCHIIRMNTGVQEIQIFQFLGSTVLVKLICYTVNLQID